MSVVNRAVDGVRAVATDPVGRRAYLARLKWLINGSGGLHAHSLEYRAGLTGAFAIPASRSHPDDEAVMHCPPDCGAHAPLSHLYERRFVYGLQKTVASTMSGATLMCGSSEPPFFVRESITWPYESILSHGLEVPEVRQAQSPVPGSSAVFPTTANYYHWLVEDLPTVLRVAHAYPGTDFHAFADGMTDKHRTVARVLDVDVRPAALVMAFDNQLLAGRADDSWFVHPADAALLREFGLRLTDGAATSGEGRIYVSRRGTGRSLPDEERLESLLAERGFTVVRLEDLDWVEQVRMFQGARVVVAPHGAGLANLAFTPPGATLVELTFGLHYNRCFEWMCHVGGHRYLKVDGDSGHGDPIADVLALLD